MFRAAPFGEQLSERRATHQAAGPLPQGRVHILPAFTRHLRDQAHLALRPLPRSICDGRRPRRESVLRSGEQALSCFAPGAAQQAIAQVTSRPIDRVFPPQRRIHILPAFPVRLRDRPRLDLWPLPRPSVVGVCPIQDLFLAQRREIIRVARPPLCPVGGPATSQPASCAGPCAVRPGRGPRSRPAPQRSGRIRPWARCRGGRGRRRPSG